MLESSIPRRDGIFRLAESLYIGDVGYFSKLWGKSVELSDMVCQKYPKKRGPNGWGGGSRRGTLAILPLKRILAKNGTNVADQRVGKY